jgi:hypothetical protein
MPLFDAGGGETTPFGKNQYLRSTVGNKFESYTLAAASVPTEEIDGTDEKVVQSGEVLAKITSGAEAGKVGPFQADATDGRQTAANIVGISDTFVPWQLLHGDVEVGVLYIGTVVQGWCFERNAAGERIALTNTTVDAMRGTKGLDITAK